MRHEDRPMFRKSEAIGAASVRRTLACLILLCSIPAAASAQGTTTAIRLNQVGFFPTAVKQAVVVDAPTNAFRIRTPDGVRTVYEGTMAVARTWVSAQENVRLADFSALQEPGSYVMEVDGLGTSYAFEIAVEPLQRVAVAAVKGFYFQRASTRLAAQYAGQWTRAAGHPDTSVKVHASAASASRPEGTVIASPRGWYDAGDYNKYVVNSGITTGQLLQLYEHYPAYFDAFATNIPESSNTLPDLLDEVLWNLRWMMTMQDPADGGLYHKLTTANFEPMVRPSAATDQRWVVQKSTPAALDFAAVAALGARVFRPFEATVPGLADSLLDASFRAWNWAQANPGDRYSQSAMNAAFDPDINTGEYGDGSFLDEFRWAATELYLTTRADSFLYMYPPSVSGNASVPGWPNVASVATVSFAHHRHAAAAVLDTTELRRHLLGLVNQLVEGRRNNPYGVGIGNATNDFYWGSNSYVANQAYMTLAAYRWTRDARYLDFAVANLDYLLGRNATGYSFVTDHGDKVPLFPHHRPSESDGIARPVPGLLVGGPNAGREDGCSYPYPPNAPAKSYVDSVCSYASNEIAINWQSSLAYLAGAVAAHLTPGGLPLSTGRETGPEGVSSPGLEVWPNPAGSSVNVRVRMEQGMQGELALYDMLGRRTPTGGSEAFFGPGSHDVALDTADLAPGVYFARFVSAMGTRTVPIVVVR